MNFLQSITAPTEAVESAAHIVFKPENFVSSLQYMGTGMLVIFAVIGLIALTTMLINKVFSE